MTKLKKVLIVTYYWPPAGGPGVQRWLKFAKYLPEFGVEPIVLVPENAFYPIQDHSHQKDLSSNVIVYKAKTKEPAHVIKSLFPKKINKLSDGGMSSNTLSWFSKWLIFLRGNFFIPDARVGWVKPALNQVDQILTDHPEIETIITTGPPHSVHLTGLKAKNRYSEKIKWIADFRDPWTDIKYHKFLRLGKRAKKRHETLEHQVLSTADHIVTTSWYTADSFRLKTKQPVSVITNGFDGDDFKAVKRANQTFSMTHVGSLLPDRDPIQIWALIREFLDKRPDAANDLKITLVGYVDREILKTLQTFGLMPFVELKGLVSHQIAIDYMSNASLLFLVEQEPHVIPGKLFEYLKAHKIILAQTSQNSDVSRILKEIPQSVILTSEDAPDVSALSAFYDCFKANHLEQPDTDVSKYDRRELAKQMAILVFKRDKVE